MVLISDSVGNIEEGSSQLNALLFPIVASIAIILALQIVIIARPVSYTHLTLPTKA